MKLRNHVEWALHCCSVLAALPEGERIPAKLLAEFHGIPKEYLAKALQALSSAGLVEGSLGPSGGYMLAKPAADVTFLDVVEAVEGPGPAFVCTEIRENIPCVKKPSQRGSRPCVVARLMWEAESVWRDKLRSTTLADLVGMVQNEVPAEDLHAGAVWLGERMAKKQPPGS